MSTLVIEAKGEPTGWIPLAEFCAKHNQKVTTIHKRVADGAWPRGVIYSCPDGEKSYVHEERALAWVKGKPTERFASRVAEEEAA